MPLRVRTLVRSAQLYLLALFVPFVAAVLALSRPRAPGARNVIWIFIVFYGAVFYIAADSNSDSVRYAKLLVTMHQDLYGLGDLLSQFFAEKSRYQDVYQPLLTYFVSRLTDQHWLLFASFGVLFGFVYTRNVWFLIDRVPAPMGPLFGFLIAAFAFSVDIGSGLNGVRMWTALHVFVFCVLHYFATGDRKFLLLLLLTPMIHFSFWLPVALMAGFLQTRHFGLMIYGFFIISSGSVILDLSIVKDFMAYMPLPIEQRASGYILSADVNSMSLDERVESQVWFLRWNYTMLAAFVLFSTSWMVWRGCLRQRDLVRELLVFGMLMYAVVNLVSYIPSLGRFYNLAEMLLLAALILFLADRSRSKAIDRRVFGAAGLLLTINLVLGVRLMLNFASIWLLAGNVFLSPFVEADLSLYELVNWVR